MEERSRVDLWRVDLTLPTDGALLAPDERERARGYHFDRDRRRFVNSRAALRRILASCLDADAHAIAFALGEHGKPRVAGDTSLEFSLSRSGELALIAVTRGQRLGVDVEQLAPLPELDDLIAQQLTPVEQAELRAIEDATARRDRFYCVWTEKEACLKATGIGLGREPSTFAIRPQAGSAILRVESASWPEAGSLRVHDLDLPGVAAAIALDGATPSVQLQH